MSKIINWGIIGLGKIAHKFAEDLQLVEDANLLAVASRDIENAKSFAKKFSANQFYSSYKALVENPNVDVVYIATPHALHYEHTLLCLNANKAVLCEKAFAMNAAEVKEMIRTAKARNVFLMEALWTRFIPGTLKTLALIKEGSIGKIHSVEADFGFIGDTDPEKRLFNKRLGGGALFDIGIYPVFLSILILGAPKYINAHATMAATGVDAEVKITFAYESG
ncbi:MAG: Gfo/Idh/MocA family oxidoreductase [Bacteroidales bacterium]|nr:Gfo/Idh/MocA family oxidoreductase [Bacteroidales bacterium]